MESGEVPTFLQGERGKVLKMRNKYNVDMWKEFRKRWMVFGVLIAMALAVVAPRLGALGGNYNACSLIDHSRTHCTSSQHFLNVCDRRLRQPYVDRYLGQELTSMADVCLRAHDNINFDLVVSAASVNYPDAELAGPLHTEVLSLVPLWYIYYSAGRAGAGDAVRPSARLAALSALHAHAAAPALALLAVTALRDAGLHRALIEGSLMARARGPCGWLALCWGGAPAAPAPALAALNYALSLLHAPLAMLYLCGRSAAPAPRAVARTVLLSVPPFVLGRYSAARAPPLAAPPALHARLAALLLLYVDCCTLLRDAEGSLHVSDVLATLFIEVGCVCASAACTAAYVRAGWLRRRELRALVLAAVPKSLALDWDMQPSCMSSALARLPAVFLAPAQALLLAAWHPDDCDDDADERDDPAPPPSPCSLC